jgi:hypothetical protein
LKTPTKKTTNRATEFSNDLKRFLDEHKIFNKKHNLSWERNGMSNEEKVGTVDVVGYTGKTPRIIIEAELLREDPASNVVKVWNWAARSKKKPKNILMIQAFSKAYRSRKNRAKQLAKFVGKRMHADVSAIEYIPITIPYNPRPGGKVGAGRRRFHARHLGSKVIQIIRRYE